MGASVHLKTALCPKVNRLEMRHSRVWRRTVYVDHCLWQLISSPQAYDDTCKQNAWSFPECIRNWRCSLMTASSIPDHKDFLALSTHWKYSNTERNEGRCFIDREKMKLSNDAFTLMPLPIADDNQPTTLSEIPWVSNYKLTFEIYVDWHRHESEAVLRSDMSWLSTKGQHLSQPRTLHSPISDSKSTRSFFELTMNIDSLNVERARASLITYARKWQWVNIVTSRQWSFDTERKSKITTLLWLIWQRSIVTKNRAYG